MSQYVTKIRTNQGDKQIDYNALANLPTISNSNQNLLINSNFKDAVNQRGKSSYSNTSNWQWCYGIDRWALNGGLNTMSVTVNEASITVVNNGTEAAHFRQLFERKYDSGYYTATLNIIAVTGIVKVYLDASNKSSTLTVGKNVFTTSGSPEFFNLLLDPGSSIELEYIKLEAGKMSTQFIPRFKGEEIMLCYRYFYAHESRLIMTQYSTQHADGNIFYPIRMRRKPDVTLLEGTYFSSVKSSFLTPASLIVNDGYFDAHSATLKLEKNSTDTFTAGMSINANIKICLDAEIY